MNTDKIYAEQLANEYAPKDTSKVVALRKLDKKAKLAEIEEKYYREFVKQFSRRENMVSDFFIHVICRTGWGKVLGQNYEDLGL